jgi:hypothetical protein
MKRLVLAASLVALPALAQEPLTFKGFQLGATRAEFLAPFSALASSCKDDNCHGFPAKDCATASPESPRHKQCEPFTYAGIYPETMSATFRDDRLVSVLLVYASEKFEQMKAAMLERFGPPQDTKTEMLQNRMGASFENQSLTWLQGDALLQLSQRFNRVDQGMIGLVSKQHVERRKNERKDETKARAKDM